MLLVIAHSALAALLLLAAIRDVLTRMLPDGIALAIALIALALHAPAGWTSLLASAATAALLFGILLVLAIRGWLGGGDVKLAAALALALPPAATLDFLVVTTLAGGVLGMAYLAGPSLAPRLAPAGDRGLLVRVMAVEAWRLRRGGPLPYGVAIAAGGLITLFAGP